MNGKLQGDYTDDVLLGRDSGVRWVQAVFIVKVQWGFEREDSWCVFVDCPHMIREYCYSWEKYSI